MKIALYVVRVIYVNREGNDSVGIYLKEEEEKNEKLFTNWIVIKDEEEDDLSLI